MKASTMRRVRALHLYLGLFFAPMLLLFAVSGGIQVFRLNEAKGYGGTPPSWMVTIASIHKNQAIPHFAAARPAKAKLDKPAKTTARKSLRSLWLEIFVVVLAIALALSILLGVTIALQLRRTRRIGIAMLAAGTIVPIILLLL